MRKRIIAWGLIACLLLSGCSAMLERSYQTSAPHEDKPITAEDASYVRVEDYRELVSAVLYLVSQGEEEGVIRLYDYAGDVDTDLSDACLEVATQDPLGAYAVEYIKHEYTRVVAYYQATVSIRYRRTPEQVASIVRVTGSSAIRERIRQALEDFREEAVLRVSYFAEDESSLQELVRQAYYDNPGSALGLPEVEISLYPSAGRDRIIELVMTYPGSTPLLRVRRDAAEDRAEELSASLRGMEGEQAALAAAGLLAENAVWDSEGDSTVYAALVDGAADDEGLALAYALLCQSVGLSCDVMEGELAGESRMWNVLALPGGVRYYDPAAGEGELCTPQELARRGYTWPGAPQVERTEVLAPGESPEAAESGGPEGSPEP